jgi:hypothetical protein
LPSEELIAKICVQVKEELVPLLQQERDKGSNGPGNARLDAKINQVAGSVESLRVQIDALHALLAVQRRLRAGLD